jgi:hypothetical protein
MQKHPPAFNASFHPFVALPVPSAIISRRFRPTAEDPTPAPSHHAQVRCWVLRTHHCRECMMIVALNLMHHRVWAFWLDVCHVEVLLCCRCGHGCASAHSWWCKRMPMSHHCYDAFDSGRAACIGRTGAVHVMALLMSQIGAPRAVASMPKMSAARPTVLGTRCSRVSLRVSATAKAPVAPVPVRIQGRRLPVRTTNSQA